MRQNNRPTIYFTQRIYRSSETESKVPIGKLITKQHMCTFNGSNFLQAIQARQAIRQVELQWDQRTATSGEEEKERDRVKCRAHAYQEVTCPLTKLILLHGAINSFNLLEKVGLKDTQFSNIKQQLLCMQNQFKSKKKTTSSAKLFM